MAGSRITDADIAMSIPLAPVSRALATLNAAPPPERTITIRSTGANGFFWKDDPTWCGSFAELGGPDGLQASVPLSNFTIVVPEPSLVILSVDAAVALQRGDVHWQFRGLRVRGPFGLGNVCPPGGGFGGHIGATGATSFTLRAGLKLVQEGGDGGFRYDLSLLSPASVSMTLSFGFQGIGNLGVPESFNIPHGVLMSGKIPLLFQTRGTVKLPGGAARSYSVAITPKTFAVSPMAIEGSWTGKVEFKPAT